MHFLVKKIPGALAAILLVCSAVTLCAQTLTRPVEGLRSKRFQLLALKNATIVQAPGRILRNAFWFGTRILLTIYFIKAHHTLSFGDMVIIDFGGMGISSIAAVLLTRGMLKFSRHGEITLREYLRFGGPLTVITIFNNFIRQLDVFIVQYFFSIATVGIYQSAKTLYRAFDQAFDAVTSLFYPGAVKLIADGRRDDLVVVVSKILSFTLLPTLAMVLLLELGLSRFIIETFLQSKYLQAVGQFNILVLAAVFMPFMILSSLVVALGASRTLLVNILISSFVAFGVFVLVGIFQAAELIPLGVVVYIALSGILNLIFVRKSLGIPYSMIFRSVTDTRNFLRARKNSRQNSKSR